MSWIPTRKWLGTLVAGLLTIAAQAVGSGVWNNTEWAQVLTLLSGLALAYFIPSQSTTDPGPAAAEPRGAPNSVAG